MNDFSMNHDSRIAANPLILQTMEYVKGVLGGEPSGHDWWHAYRVWSVAKTIARHEGGNLLTIELAALLHDVADRKLNHGNLEAGLNKIRQWLHALHVNDATIHEVTHIIGNMSFQGANVPSEIPLPLEGKIVQDADRLDAIGAIGIARTFAYGGATGRILYDPDIQIEMHASSEAYFQNQHPSIQHFYEKLLLLKDRMNTRYAQEMASKRHVFMETFLEQFYAEWEGKT